MSDQPSSKDLCNELRTRYECTAGCTRDIYIPKHRDLDLRAADEIERLNGMIDAMVKFSDSQVEGFHRRLGESNEEIVRLQTEGERLRRELTGANRAIAHFMGPEGGKYIDRFAAMLAGPVSLEESIRKSSSSEPSDDLYLLLVRRGYAQHEAHEIADMTARIEAGQPALPPGTNAVSSIDFWQQRGYTDARFRCGESVLFNGKVESVVVKVRERQYVIGGGTVAWEHELRPVPTKEVKP